MSINPKQVGKVLTITNRTAAGAVGSAAATVDGARALEIMQTTSGPLALTLPNPTDTVDHVALDVVNMGSANFTMYGATVVPATALRVYWNGSAWSPTFSPTMGGATATTAGTAGIAPAPAVAQQDAKLAGDGTWNITGRQVNVSQANMTANVTLVAASTVDVCEALVFNQTTANITATLPNPSDMTRFRMLMVANVGATQIAVACSAGTLNVAQYGIGIFVWVPAANRWLVNLQ